MNPENDKRIQNPERLELFLEPVFAAFDEFYRLRTCESTLGVDRVLVDGLGLDLDLLREIAVDWETEYSKDWAQSILLAASGEAAVALKPYINTEHVLLALLNMWPNAPCSAEVLRAAGGTIQGVRFVIAPKW